MHTDVGPACWAATIHYHNPKLTYLNRIIPILAELTSDFTILQLEVIFHVVVFFSFCLIVTVSVLLSLFLQKTQEKKDLSKLAEITQPVLLEGGQWSGVGELLSNKSWHSHLFWNF